MTIPKESPQNLQEITGIPVSTLYTVADNGKVNSSHEGTLEIHIDRELVRWLKEYRPNQTTREKISKRGLKLLLAIGWDDLRHAEKQQYDVERIINRMTQDVEAIRNSSLQNHLDEEEMDSETESLPNPLPSRASPIERAMEWIRRVFRALFRPVA